MHPFLMLTLVALACNTGDVRLAGSSTSTAGTVEVCSNGLWYLVCDEGWSQEDAIVACKSAGFSALGGK